jgi:hypothetical protein
MSLRRRRTRPRREEVPGRAPACVLDIFRQTGAILEGHFLHSALPKGLDKEETLW